MNVLDENIIESQCVLLSRWRVRFRQIGVGLGQAGIDDQSIVALLHGLRRPTFFTRDRDFYERRLCHAGYCLVYMAIGREEVAVFIRRLLGHPAFATQAARLGKVIQLGHAGVRFWDVRTQKERLVAWPMGRGRARR